MSDSHARAPFVRRHIGPDDVQVDAMLDRLGHTSLEALMDAAVPKSIRSAEALLLPPAVDEETAAAELRGYAAANVPGEPMIGLGYHGTVTPAVIRRNVLEDPSWYTAYTPYQPEISQGRLEALINFQTMVADLTGLHTSGSSLLDEGTAAAEAVAASGAGTSSVSPEPSMPATAETSPTATRTSSTPAARAATSRRRRYTSGLKRRDPGSRGARPSSS